MVVKGIKGFSEGASKYSTMIALLTARNFAMFISFRMTT